VYLKVAGVRNLFSCIFLIIFCVFFLLSTVISGMGQTPGKRAGNAAVLAAVTGAAYHYDKVGGRPRGRPKKKKVGEAGGWPMGWGRHSRKYGDGPKNLKCSHNHGGIYNLRHVRGRTWTCTDVGPDVVICTDVSEYGWGVFAKSDVPAYTVLGRLPHGEEVTELTEKMDRYKDCDKLHTKAGIFYMGAPLDYPRGKRQVVRLILVCSSPFACLVDQVFDFDGS